MSDVVYLYGFVPRGTPVPPEGVSGIAGAPIRVTDVGPFDAAVAHLPAAEYREGSIEGRLKDLAWVADHGARHETVVTWFADKATIVPARLLTVFTSEGALRQEAHTKRSAILRSLARFESLREWDLKVSFDQEAIAPHLGEFSAEAAEVEAAMSSAAAGRRYLLGRKREDVARRAGANVARQLAEGLLADVGEVAEEVTEIELSSRSHGNGVVLAAALLVRSEDSDRLLQLVGELTPPLDERGVVVALTGPWAPYRFLGDGDDD